MRDKEFFASTAMAVVYLAVGIIATYATIVYATESSSSPVTDIILSNIRVYDVDGIFVYGPLFFWAVIIAYLFFEPKKIPFTLKSLAIFLLIRSFFVSLTHVGPFPVHAQINTTGFLGILTSGNDLFFSNHTGMPFLMALIFWDDVVMRVFCIASSVVFGIIVLLAHVHYSIDVFGAFFITYTIYHITEHLFKEDRRTFFHGLKI